MRLSLTQEARQQQTQRIDPRQILASDILAWSTVEMEAAIERELAENPALESRETGEETIDSAALLLAAETILLDGGAAASALVSEDGNEACGGGSPSFSVSVEARAGRDGVGSAYSSGSVIRSAWNDDVDPLDSVASGVSLRDHLRAQIGQVTPDAALRPVVAYLVDSVDERGYLVCTIEEVADEFHLSPSCVEEAVRALQAMDPLGVGARSLRECLLLQVRQLEEAGEAHPLAARILNRCWPELTARREDKIAARLRVTAGEVRGAMRFLRSALTPNPGDSFRPDWSSRVGGAFAGLGPASMTQAAEYAPLRPDLVFRHAESGFVAELARDFESALILSPEWARLAADNSDRTSAANADDATQRYLREHVDRAQAFLVGVARRGTLLRRIAAALVERQPGYLVTGDRAFLRPLTRQTVADILGTDESVISRAVRGKWAQLPTGDIVPLDSFFGNAHAVRDALVDAIAREDPRHPYSDDELVDLLTAQGFPLARRTVAKYRGQERILSARLRRRAPQVGKAI